jgi:hypothetical protein
MRRLRFRLRTIMVAIAAIAIWSWVVLIRLPHIETIYLVKSGIDGSYAWVKVFTENPFLEFHSYDVRFPLSYIAIIPALIVLGVAFWLRRKRGAVPERNGIGVNNLSDRSLTRSEPDRSGEAERA